MADDYVAYTCPHCEKRYLETVALLPYVRGFFRAAQFGNKKIVGCRACVRKQLLLETGESCLLGWFNPVGLAANPVLIVYGFGRSLVVSRNVEGVRALLREAGIAEPEAPADPVRIAYSLAAAMIAADGRILPDEVDAAIRIGREIFDRFDAGEFRSVVATHAELPEPAELASILKTILTEEGKTKVYRYLLAIASADQEIAPQERSLLKSVAGNLGVDATGQGVDVKA